MPLIKVSDGRREDMLVGALEGGSNFWYWIGEEAGKVVAKYQGDDEPFSTAMWKAIKAGETIEVHDCENMEEKLGEINLKSIDEGEDLMFEKSQKHFIDIINEEDDAETADVWFQYCVLKSLVYG